MTYRNANRDRRTARQRKADRMGWALIAATAAGFMGLGWAAYAADAARGISPAESLAQWGIGRVPVADSPARQSAEAIRARIAGRPVLIGYGCAGASGPIWAAEESSFPACARIERESVR